MKNIFKIKIKWLSSTTLKGIVVFSLKIYKEHPVLTSHFDCTKISTDISETHNSGQILSDNCDIVLNSENEISNNKNYFLACLNEHGLGKVAFMNIGHNNYNEKDFSNLTVNESKIIVNVLTWLNS